MMLGRAVCLTCAHGGTSHTLSPQSLDHKYQQDAQTKPVHINPHICRCTVQIPMTYANTIGLPHVRPFTNTKCRNGLTMVPAPLESRVNPQRMPFASQSLRMTPVNDSKTPLWCNLYSPFPTEVCICPILGVKVVNIRSTILRRKMPVNSASAIASYKHPLCAFFLII